MTIGDLLQKLTLLMKVNPGDITTDTEIYVTVGVLKGIVKQKLQEDEEFFGGSVIYFSDDATHLGAEAEWNDEKDGEEYRVFISAGADLEIPPIM